LDAGGDVWRGGGVGAEVGAIGKFFREMWCVRSKVEGEGLSGWLNLCIFVCGLVKECGEPV
jgi:hypothetical protein